MIVNSYLFNLIFESIKYSKKQLLIIIDENKIFMVVYRRDINQKGAKPHVALIKRKIKH